MLSNQLQWRVSCVRQSMPPCADADGLGRQSILRRRGTLPEVPDAQRILRARKWRMYRGAVERMRKISLSGADRAQGQGDLRASSARGIRGRRNLAQLKRAKSNSTAC